MLHIEHIFYMILHLEPSWANKAMIDKQITGERQWPIRSLSGPSCSHCANRETSNNKQHIGVSDVVLSRADVHRHGRDTQNTMEV